MIAGPLAIFDLDRTLHAGSGLGVLARHAFRDRLISRDRLARSLAHDLLFRKRGSTDGQISSIAELALEMGAGMSVDELADVVGRTAREIAASVRPAMHALVELHREADHGCVLLSASPQGLVEEIAELLGFDIGIGTRIEHTGGVLTGRIHPPMCYGDGKLTRLAEAIGWQADPAASNGDGSAATSSRPDVISSYAYADSISDLPLLEAVDAPFVVSPDRRLRRLANDRGWPVLDT